MEAIDTTTNKGRLKYYTLWFPETTGTLEDFNDTQWLNWLKKKFTGTGINAYGFYNETCAFHIVRIYIDSADAGLEGNTSVTLDNMVVGKVSLDEELNEHIDLTKGKRYNYPDTILDKYRNGNADVTIK
jgi:hypothetical protein